MSFTHTVTHRVLYNDGSSSFTKEHVDDQTAGEEHTISEEIADSTANGLVAYTLDFSQAKTFIMWSTTAMTVYTNEASTGSPAQTFVLVANVPIAWSDGQVASCPITTDITALYVTNASGSAGDLNIRSLQDPTV